ncbi:GAF domain-containing protein [Actinoplanes siamensis]|uniref:GAF domain-containing protein n=1 Tax=Actinoplanes siamensis TaxID=1223317 RepID=A0A919N0K7_9ACTN|nr:GAF domain-containing protein [Actinoplanes siamensis]GIF02700.1 hypothetical protein Asi03nite_02380 [Actinoplanes siamensis]
MGTELGTRDPTRQPINRLVQAVADTTDSPMAMAYLVVGSALRVIACRGLDPIAVGDQLSLDGSLSGVVVHTGLPLIINDVGADVGLAGRDLVRSHDLKAYAGFPVRDEGGAVIAVLAVAAHQPRHWTVRQLRCLDDDAQMLADVLSCGVRQTRARAGAASATRDLVDLLAVIGSYAELALGVLNGPAPSRSEISAARDDLEQIIRAAEQAARLARRHPPAGLTDPR